MLRNVMLTVALMLGAARPVPAQQHARLEVGVTLADINVVDFDFLRVATGNADGSVFVRIYLSEELFVEPEASFVFVGDGAGTISVLTPAVNIGRRFVRAGRAGAWFLAGHVAAQLVEVDGVHGDAAVGGAVGYWKPVLDRHASVRVEGRVRHWIDADVSTLGVALKIALLVR